MTLEQFNPRTFEQILLDMVNMIRTNVPELTDFNVGSRIRSILETSALEDDEQYHQMTVLLLLWNLDNVRGRDLDERLAEWNISRQRAIPSTGEVVVSDNDLITTFLTTAIGVGSVSENVLSSAGFPTSGYPYTIRIGEGTSNVEDVTVSANDTTSGIFTSSATTKDHAANERVSYVSGASNVAASGQRVRVRGALEGLEVTATLIEDATVQPGDYDSNSARAIVDFPGAIGNVAKGAFREFAGSSPFDGALVRNDAAFFGGIDEESDDAFRSRARKKIQSLARGTVLSLEQLVVGVEYTGVDGVLWRVISSKVKEFFGRDGNDWVYLYIWPGAFDFIETEIVTTPEVLTSSAEDGQKFFRLAHTAVVPSSIVVEYFPVNGVAWERLTHGVHYYLNEGTGWLEVIDPSRSSISDPITSIGLNKGDQLRAFQYRYYEGLIQKVQTVLNGMERNPVQFPGIASAGVKVLATFPRPVKIKDIRAAIQVNEGFTEANVAPLVRDAISRYLSELKVGDDIILAEMIERSMGVDGMFNIQFSYPVSDIVLVEDQIVDQEDLDIFVS